MANPENSTYPDANEAPTATNAHASEENRWLMRFEDLLKVKNVDDLKTELGRLAGDVQSEIQNFDLNSHLSPEAKTRLKSLESRYGQVMKAVHKAQKQFDREFNKSLRVLKATRQDAEKHLRTIKTRITKHRGTIVKASSNLKSNLKMKIKKTAKKATAVAKGSAKKTTRKVKSKASSINA